MESFKDFIHKKNPYEYELELERLNERQFVLNAIIRRYNSNQRRNDKLILVRQQIEYLNILIKKRKVLKSMMFQIF
jgi:hypothetical protein